MVPLLLTAMSPIQWSTTLCPVRPGEPHLSHNGKCYKCASLLLCVHSVATCAFGRTERPSAYARDVRVDDGPSCGFNPMEHNTITCATGGAAVVAQEQKPQLRSLASLCVCSIAIYALGHTKRPSAYARGVRVDDGPSRGHEFAVCCVEFRTKPLPGRSCSLCSSRSTPTLFRVLQPCRRTRPVCVHRMASPMLGDAFSTKRWRDADIYASPSILENPLRTSVNIGGKHLAAVMTSSSCPTLKVA